MVMPTVAEEDCTNTVSTVPVSTHRRMPPVLPASNLVKKAMNSGWVLSGLKPFFISSMP